MMHLGPVQPGPFSKNLKNGIICDDYTLQTHQDDSSDDHARMVALTVS